MARSICISAIFGLLQKIIKVVLKHLMQRRLAVKKKLKFINTVADLEKVVQKDQQDVLTLEDLGIAYMQQQKNKEGLAYLEKAIVAGSKNKDVYFQVGNGRFKDNNFNGAIEAYDKAISFG